MSLDIAQWWTPHLETLTRASLLSQKNNSILEPWVFYCIVDYNRWTVWQAQITLRAVANNEVSMHADVKTQFDDEAREWRYDIDTNRLTFLADNLDNEVTGQNAVDTFPRWNTAVYDNRVLWDAQVVYNWWSVYWNTFNADSNTTINTSNFRNNVVDTDANVVSSGNTQRNHFEAQSDTTINSWDFRENKVEADANVVSSTSWDVDNNIFRSSSNTTVSWTANIDNSEVHTDATLTLSGWNVVTSTFWNLSNTTISWWTFADNNVWEDADVVIVSWSNYENVFGKSTVYRQVWTGYIRYSNIEWTTSRTNWNTNVSNVNANTATVNTTGSAWSIFNSLLQRAYMANIQNIPSLTITDSTVSNYWTVQTNASTRIYIYRSTITDWSRFLCSANSRIDISYTHLNSYSYVQSTGNGWYLRANYCNLSSLWYIRNQTTNQHLAERCEVTSQSSIRFDWNADNCRAYYCEASSWGAIYHTTGSVGCYTYYCTADSLWQIYTQGSTNARIYYSNADARAYVRSLNCTWTHYIYYGKSSASWYIQMSWTLGRIYACRVDSQSILEKRWANNSNIYYSSFTAYYYAYITRTAGTTSWIYGMWRRTNTITDPVAIAPYAVWGSRQNF